jgi:hypothetical protein
VEQAARPSCLRAGEGKRCRKGVGSRGEGDAPFYTSSPRPGGGQGPPGSALPRSGNSQELIVTTEEPLEERVQKASSINLRCLGAKEEVSIRKVGRLYSVKNWERLLRAVALRHCFA